MTNTAGPQRLKGMTRFENCMIDDYQRIYLYCYDSLMEVNWNVFLDQNPEGKPLKC